MDSTKPAYLLSQIDPQKHRDAMLDELWAAVPTPFHGFSETRMCRIRGYAVYVHRRGRDWYRQVGSGKVVFASRDMSEACDLATQKAIAHLT